MLLFIYWYLLRWPCIFITIDLKIEYSGANSNYSIKSSFLTVKSANIDLYLNNIDIYGDGYDFKQYDLNINFRYTSNYLIIENVTIHQSWTYDTISLTNGNLFVDGLTVQTVYNEPNSAILTLDQIDSYFINNVEFFDNWYNTHCFIQITNFHTSNTNQWNSIQNSRFYNNGYYYGYVILLNNIDSSRMFN